jgi:hypothetical protein
MGSWMFPVLLLLPSLAQSQTRLEQLEATYQANLRALDAPILQDYLRQLELLKSVMTARNRPADAKQVDAEIERVKAIASTTGVLPYTELEAALDPPAAGTASQPSATAQAPAKTAPAALPTLLAAEAFQGAPLHAKTGAIPLGSAEWRIFKLPAGTYEVLMVFATEALPLPEQLTFNLGGREFKAVVAPDRATGSPEAFRLLRICQVTLDAEVIGNTLRVTPSSTHKPLIWLKKLIIA